MVDKCLYLGIFKPNSNITMEKRNNIRRKLQDYRKKNEMSFEKMAEILEIDSEIYTLIEQNNHPMPSKMLKNIFSKLDLP